METTDVGRLLQEMGCAMGQAFLLARPRRNISACGRCRGQSQCQRQDRDIAHRLLHPLAKPLSCAAFAEGPVTGEFLLLAIVPGLFSA